MSFKIVDWVLDHSAAEGSVRLVALVLAENADQDTGECYPSVATIARRARVSVRTAQTALRVLEELEELETRSHQGQGKRMDRKTNLYVLTGYLRSRGAKAASRESPAGCDPASDGVRDRVGTGCNLLPSNQEIEPRDERLPGNASQSKKSGDSIVDAQLAQRRIMDENREREETALTVHRAPMPEALLRANRGRLAKEAESGAMLDLPPEIVEPDGRARLPDAGAASSSDDGATPPTGAER